METKDKLFYMRHQNIWIGTFTEDGVNGNLTYTSYEDNAQKVPHFFGYPIGLYQPIFGDGHIVGVENKVVTRSRIEHWLRTRTYSFPAGVRPKRSHYPDGWELAKETRAVSMDDFYWFSDNLDDQYDDFHPRSPEYLKRSASGQDDDISLLP